MRKIKMDEFNITHFDVIFEETHLPEACDI